MHFVGPGAAFNKAQFWKHQLRIDIKCDQSIDSRTCQTCTAEIYKSFCFANFYAEIEIQILSRLLNKNPSGGYKT